jgi:hypothetical protein
VVCGGGKAECELFDYRCGLIIVFFLWYLNAVPAIILIKSTGPSGIILIESNRSRKKKKHKSRGAIRPAPSFS